jgi:hypothetical protein
MEAVIEMGSSTHGCDFGEMMGPWIEQIGHECRFKLKAIAKTNRQLLEVVIIANFHYRNAKWGALGLSFQSQALRR